MIIYYTYAASGILLISLFLAVIFYFKGNIRLKAGRERFYLWVMSVVYLFTFSFLTIIKYQAYNMAMLDLGRMSQALWNTLHGNMLECTLWGGNACRLIAHAEFIYFLITPLYALYQDPKFLLVLQSLVISIGAMPVFLIARKVLKDRFSALCFAGAFLLYPSLQYGNIRDFHPDMLAATFLLFSFYYILQEKWRKFLVFTLLALMCKEYVSLIVIMLGFYTIFSRKKLKIGLGAVFIGALWFILTIKVIPGLLSPEWYWSKQSIYTSMGNSPEEIIRYCFSYPGTLLSRLLEPNVLRHTALILLPLGFLSLLHLKTLILAAPIYLAAALTDMPMLSYTNHHNGTTIPFIIISAIFGSAFIIRKAGWLDKNKLTRAVSVFVLLSSFLSAVMYGPSPLSWRFWHQGSYRYYGNLQQLRITEHDKIADQFIKMVPDEVPVSASNHLASHLAQRRVMHQFPFPEDFSEVDYVLVDLLEYFLPLYAFRQDEMIALKKLFQEGELGLKYWQDGILLFQKGLSPEERLYAGYSLIRKSAPAVRLDNAVFGNWLSLKGYDVISYPDNRYRLVYYWQVSDDFDIEEVGNFIIVDTLRSNNKTVRIVHLPNYILFPPLEWQPGDIIKEEFEVFIADELINNSEWKIGLYQVPEHFFIETGQEYLVPGTSRVDLGSLKNAYRN